jgi:hypothetical protein
VGRYLKNGPTIVYRDRVAPRNKISGIAESNHEPIPEANLIPGNYFWGLA